VQFHCKSKGFFQRNRRFPAKKGEDKFCSFARFAVGSVRFGRALFNSSKASLVLRV